MADSDERLLARIDRLERYCHELSARIRALVQDEHRYAWTAQRYRQDSPWFMDSAWALPAIDGQHGEVIAYEYVNGTDETTCIIRASDGCFSITTKGNFNLGDEVVVRDGMLQMVTEETTIREQ